MSTRQARTQERRQAPREWWGAAAIVLAIGILLMVMPMSVWAYGEDVSCGSVLTTLDQPFDWEQADDGDGDVCGDDLADRGAQGGLDPSASRRDRLASIFRQLALS